MADRMVEKLERELITRDRSTSWLEVFGMLPDPDPVLRKLGEDITTYRSLLSDAHVWSTVTSRKGATLSRELEITLPPGGSKRADRKALDACLEVVDGLDLHQVVTDMLDAPLFGMAPLEVVWDKSGGEWRPVRVEGKPPEWFKFTIDNQLRFVTMDAPVEGEEIPPMKLLLARHYASYGNPYGERTLSRCFWPAAFKKGGFKFWSIFAEKYGFPWVFGRVPRSATDGERDRLLSNLVGMVQDAVGVINDDESVTMEESGSKAGSADVFNGLISAGNREISKAVIGQTLSTEIDQGGSYAASKSHMDVRADIAESDQKMIVGPINLLLSWYCRLNHPAAVPPTAQWYEEEDVQKDRAERDKTLHEQGVRFTRTYYERVYNLEPSDFEIKEETEPEPPAVPVSGEVPPQEDGDDTQDDDGGEFAEGDEPPNRIDLAMGTADAASLAAADAVEREILGPIFEAVRSAGSLEEIGELLSGLYPKLGTDRFQELLARSMTFAGLTGGTAVIDETGGSE